MNKVRNKIYNLSDLSIGDRFVKLKSLKNVFEVLRNDESIIIVDCKIIDSKVGDFDKNDYGKKSKDCLVKFLRNAK